MKFIDLEKKILVLDINEKPNGCSWKDLATFIKNYQLAEKEFDNEKTNVIIDERLYTEYRFSDPVKSLKLYNNGDIEILEILEINK